MSGQIDSHPLLDESTFNTAATTQATTAQTITSRKINSKLAGLLSVLALLALSAVALFFVYTSYLKSYQAAQKSKLANTVGTTSVDLSGLGGTPASLQGLGLLQVNGDANITNNLTAKSFNGDGADLSNVNATRLNSQPGSFYQNASNINAGILGDQYLSGNVALLDANQTFSGNNTFSGSLTIGGTLTSGAINGQTISSAANFTGSLAVNGASLTLGTANTIAGSIVIHNAGNAFTTTLLSSTATNSKTIIFPNETGTVCTTGSVCTGYAPSSGGNYIELQAITPGIAQTGNAHISGVIVAGSYYGDGTTLTGVAKLALSNQTFVGNTQVFQNGINSTSAFSVKNAGAVNVLNVDTLSSLVTVAELITNTITPTGALTIGLATNTFTLQGSSSSTIQSTDSGTGFITTIGFTGTPTQNVSYNFDTSVAGGSYDICTTSGNCPGVGGGVTSTGGTAGTLAKFSSAFGIVDSIISESGSIATVNGSLKVGSGANSLTTNTGGFSLLAGGDITTYQLLSAGINTYDICTSSGNCFGAGGSGANAQLSNLSGVAINTSLLSGSSTIDLGSNANPFRDLYLGGTATNNFRFTGSATGPRTITLPDASGIVCIDTNNCSYANNTLSNLGTVSLSSVLQPSSPGGLSLGVSTLPFSDLYLSGSSLTPATNRFQITGISTGGLRVITLPNETGTVCTTGSVCAGYQAPLSFNNGLTNTANTIQLGGALVQNSTIDAAASFGLTVTSTLSGGARSSYPLTVSQASDATNNNSVGLLQLSNSDAGSTAGALQISQVAAGNGINITGINTGFGIHINSAITTGAGLVVATAGITSGNSVSLSGTSQTSPPAFTGRILNVAPIRNITSGTTSINDTGNYLYVARSNGVSVAATFTVSGDLATLSSNCDPTGSGVCTDTANILELNQQYASASGAVLNVLGAGTGNSATLTATNTAGTQTNGILFNRNGTGGTTTNGVNVTNTLGTTTNGLQLTQSGGTFTTGINFTGTFGNLIVAPNFSVSNAGAIVGVGVNAGSGLLQGTGGLTVSGNVTLAATAGNTVNLGNSTGALVIASGGTSSWTNTSGNLTIQTATTGTLVLDSIASLTVGGTNATGLTVGRAGVTITFGSTAWTATPTISGLITASGGLTSNGTTSVSGANTLTVGTGLVTVGGNVSFTNDGAHSISIAQSAASTAGYALSIVAGQGGSTTGAGGALNLTAGAAAAGNSSGGAVVILGGVGVGSGTSGTVDIAGGSGGWYGGVVNIAGGGGIFGGGTVTIKGGTISAVNATGATLNLAGGVGSGGDNNGGPVVIRGGAALGTATGGIVDIKGGAGGTTAGNGGAVAIVGGTSLAGVYTGGTVSLTGGGGFVGGNVDIAGGGGFGLGSINLNATTGAINIGTGLTTGALTIGGSSQTTGVTIIRGGTGVGALGGSTSGIDLLPGTAGTINIGALAGTGIITLGSSSATNSVNIGNGAGATTVNIGNAQTGGAVNIGTAMTTGTISIGGGAAVRTTNITIGSTGQTGGVTIIRGGTGTGALGGSTSGIDLLPGTAGTINIGALAGTGIITLGSSSATNSVNIGNGAGATTVSIANANTAGAVNIGTAMTSGTISIGGGSAVRTGNITIGSTGQTTGVTIIRGGTGIGGIGGSTSGIDLLPGTAGTINIGATAGTGGITLGSSSATNSVLIGNGAGATTVSIANANTAGAVNIGSAFTDGTISIGGTAQTGAINIGTGSGANSRAVTVGSSTNASTLTLQSGTGNLSITTQGTGSLNIGNNAVAQTLNIGNITGATALNLRAGSGAVNVSGINSAATIGSNIGSTAFNDTTYWANSAGWASESSTAATHTVGNTTAVIANNTNNPTGGVITATTYQITFTIASNTTATNTVTPSIGGVSGPALGANQTLHTVVITTTGTGPLTFTPTTDFDGVISAVSVQLITLANNVLAVRNSDGTGGIEFRAGGITLNNTFIGVDSGRANITGNYNSALGFQALYSNTTGDYNSALGVQALRSNTTGEANSALGFQALYLNTTGDYNSALGVQALRSNTTGDYNSALGFQALYSNTTGSSNSAFGFSALTSNTTGNGNSAFGLQALRFNTTGDYNSALGRNALNSNTTGYQNSALGYHALYFNTTGFNNSAIGRNALYLNNTGSQNFALGVSTLYSNTTGSNNSAIGNYALYSNTFGDQNSAIGFNALNSNTTGGNNIGLGYQALYSNTTGGNNIGLGYQAGYTSVAGNANTTGSFNTFIGYNAGPGTATQLQNATAIGTYAVVSQSDSLILGCINGVNGCTTSTSVGIGTVTPSSALHVSSTGTTTDAVTITANSTTTGSALFVSATGLTAVTGDGIRIEVPSADTQRYMNFTDAGTSVGSITNSGAGVAFNTTSDRRLKENIADTKYDLNTVLALKVRDYSIISDASHTIYTGFIAQELYRLFPDAVTPGNDAVDANGRLLNPWQVDYSKLTPLLAKGIQDLNTKVDNLSTTVLSMNTLQALADVNAVVVINGPLTLNGQLLVNGQATFIGKTIFSGDVTFNSDTAGIATLPAGASTIRINYSKPLATVPVVTTTPKGPISGGYWVTNETTTGFNIELESVQAEAKSFGWQAIMKQ